MSSAVLLEIKLLKERLHALEALVERERGSSDASASASGAGVTAPGPHAQPHSHGELHAAAVHTHAPLVRPAAPPAVPHSLPVPMGATRVVMHEIVMPHEVDAVGVCFGGQVLKWIDLCAGMSAKSLARRPCVTASVDSVHFLKPCRLGMVVIVAAMVNRTFNSSMEVGVRVEAEDMRTGVRAHSCSAYLTFVAAREGARGGADRASAATAPLAVSTDAVGTGPCDAAVGATATATAPAPLLPRVTPTTDEHARIYADAELRREDRLQERAALRSDVGAAAELARARLQPVTHRDGCPTLPRSLQGSFSSVALYRQSSTRMPVAPGLTTAYMTQPIMPQHANTLSITFGGQVMAWMEQCAYISASRMRGPHTLTASMDRVMFGRPTRIGDILYITSQVTAIFGSSMEVMVSIHGENPMEGNLFHCADAYVTLVTVSDVDFLAGSLAGVDLLADPSAEAAATNADDDDDSDDSAAVPPASASAAAAAAAAECAITAAPAAIEGAEASAGAGTENAGMPSDRATPPPLQCTSRLPLPPRGMQTPPPTPPTLRAIAGPTPAARVSASGHVKLLPLQLPFELAPQTETEKLRFEGALRRRQQRLGHRVRLREMHLDAARRSLDD